MKKIIVSLGLALTLLGCVTHTVDTRRLAKSSPLERGRYLVQIAGCNDCHTPGYALKAGKVAEELWLIGDSVGWQGPWGTTYPPNLRLHMQSLTEDQWLQEARTREMRPPMPWYELRVMPDEDLQAIYRYVRSLTPVGERAPEYLPPGTEPSPPVFKFVLPKGAGG